MKWASNEEKRTALASLDSRHRGQMPLDSSSRTNDLDEDSVKLPKCLYRKDTVLSPSLYCLYYCILLNISHFRWISLKSLDIVFYGKIELINTCMFRLWYLIVLKQKSFESCLCGTTNRSEGWNGLNHVECMISLYACIRQSKSQSINLLKKMSCDNQKMYLH